MCRQLGWLMNLEKSELEPKQDFDFVGYQFDLRSDRVRLAPDRWQNLQEKMLKLLSLPACPVREFMSLIGFTNRYRKASSSRPTSYETHSVASQQLEGTRITRKGDPNPQVPAPPFTMVAEGRQCTYRPTITPNKTCSANIYRRINRRVGYSLRRAHCRGTWSLPGSKLQINYLELKAVFLALKEFQDFCSNKIVLVATDNTTVVSYINKEGGRRSGPLLPYYGES